MVDFAPVWLGQMVSVLATAMSQFALTIWVYERTGSATALGLMQVFFTTPSLLLSPIAGALVDRYNRKAMMMVSDLCAGLATTFILVMQVSGTLEMWHLYIVAVVAGMGNAFQWPAYSAAISTMVAKEQYGRANGMLSLVEVGPGILAPLLAGALLPLVTLTGILSFDVVTFLLAIGILLKVRIPQPPRSGEGQKAKGGGLLQEAMFGFRYIFTRPSLLGLQMVPLFGNLFWGIAFALLAPMVLARTGNSETALGLTQSAGAIGAVAGGVIMSVWGGFKRRVHGILLGWIWSGLIGTVLLGLGQDVTIWVPVMFVGSLPFAIMTGSSQAIYQAKVPPDVQGRVFAARRMIAFLTNPLSPVIAGVLADRVLAPVMRAGSTFANTWAWLVGQGPGAGMALLMMICGMLTAMVGIAGYLVPVVRRVEDILPDHAGFPPSTNP